MRVTNNENQNINIKKRVEKIFKTTLALCPIRDIVSPLLDKWSVSALLYLGCSESLRFNELKEMIGVSPRMLTVSLKKLERNGFIKRRIYKQIPPKVEYSLTALGKGFALQILNLAEWVNSNVKEIARIKK